MRKTRRVGVTRLQWALIDAAIWATARYQATRREQAPVVLVPIVPGDGSAPFSVPCDGACGEAHGMVRW